MNSDNFERPTGAQIETHIAQIEASLIELRRLRAHPVLNWARALRASSEAVERTASRVRDLENGILDLAGCEAEPYTLNDLMFFPRERPKDREGAIAFARQELQKDLERHRACLRKLETLLADPTSPKDGSEPLRPDLA